MSNMSPVQSHLSLLGFRALDIVSGFEGTVTSVSFELYGCVQCHQDVGHGPTR